MRKLYQTDWHDINFADVSEMSPKAFPSSDFYRQFYKSFNKRYLHIDNLNPDWRQLKMNAAEAIDKKLGVKQPTSILSLGAGLGIIEGVLLDKKKYKVFLQEVAPEALRFIKDRVPSERTFIGNFPECVPKDMRFDAIVLGGIEYLLDDVEFTAMVSHARSFLKPGGTLILLSWSFYEVTVNNTVRYYIKEALIKMGFYNKKLQLWGYNRTPGELKSVIKANGFIEKSIFIDRRLSRWATFVGLFSRDDKILPC